MRSSPGCPEELVSGVSVKKTANFPGPLERQVAMQQVKQQMQSSEAEQILVT
jgi:hypothetical protein